MTAEICIVCRWQDSGKCRRNPPQMMYGTTDRYPNGEVMIPAFSCADWPEVSASDWCGEWKEKK